MKKQTQTVGADKLGLKAETLRKMSETLTDDQLRDVVGGQNNRRPCSTSATSIP